MVTSHECRREKMLRPRALRQRIGEHNWEVVNGAGERMTWPREHVEKNKKIYIFRTLKIPGKEKC